MSDSLNLFNWERGQLWYRFSLAYVFIVISIWIFDIKQNGTVVFDVTTFYETQIISYDQSSSNQRWLKYANYWSCFDKYTVVTYCLSFFKN